MSLTNIQNEGYTPPDFLEKLFKRTASESENLFKPLSNIHNFNGTSYVGTSSTSISHSIHSVSGQLRFSPTRAPKAYIFEEERVSTKKFRIFYNTVLDGLLEETERSLLWQKFEKSLNNPFQYDRLIEELRVIKIKEGVKTQKRRQSIKQESPQKLEKQEYRSGKDRKKENKKNISKSLACKSIYLNQKQKKRSASQGSKNMETTAQKQKIQKNMKFIRGVLKHGDKYIKNK